MNGSRYLRRPGFGHVFGLFFLFRHPVILLVLAAVVLAVYLYRQRR
jgi:hypothetical protein